MIGAIPIIAENRIREAIEQGDFDHLEGAGKPFDDADGHYDPDWWLRRKLQQEQLTTEYVASIIEKPGQISPTHQRT